MVAKVSHEYLVSAGKCSLVNAKELPPGEAR